MDTLRIQQDASSQFSPVEIAINGVALTELIRRFEFGAAQHDAHWEPGGYLAFVPGEVFLPCRRFLGEAKPSDDFYGTGKVTILDCSCAGGGCRPFGTQIKIADDWISWSDFEVFRGGLDIDYAAFGPFTFARQQYERELAQEWTDRCGFTDHRTT